MPRKKSEEPMCMLTIHIPIKLREAIRACADADGGRSMNNWISAHLTKAVKQEGEK